MQCLDYPLLQQDALPGFFWGGWGRHPTPVKRGKMHDKGHIWGKFSVNVVLHLYICVTHIIPYYIIC